MVRTLGQDWNCQCLHACKHWHLHSIFHSIFHFHSAFHINFCSKPAGGVGQEIIAESAV